MTDRDIDEIHRKVNGVLNRHSFVDDRPHDSGAQLLVVSHGVYRRHTVVYEPLNEAVEIAAQVNTLDWSGLSPPPHTVQLLVSSIWPDFLRWRTRYYKLKFVWKELAVRVSAYDHTQLWSVVGRRGRCWRRARRWCWRYSRVSFRTVRVCIAWYC